MPFIAHSIHLWNCQNFIKDAILYNFICSMTFISVLFHADFSIFP
nr:MAG TPA: hypothetical protein [Caudoviricetes sp.]